MRAYAPQAAAATAPAGQRPPIQRKAVLGPVDDPLEREADRVAEAVVDGRQAEAITAASFSAPQRKCAECADEEKGIQRKEAGPGNLTTGSGSPGQSAVLSIVRDALQSPGQPLDAAMRAYFEPRFGRDFGSVRLHTDAQAGRTAQLLDAQAYTVGRDIVFAPSRFDPASGAGRNLLAHELAHTVQQCAHPRAQGANAISRAGDPSERSADAAAEAALANRSVPLLGPAEAAVARRPAAPARKGFSIQVVVNEPVDGHEFCIRAIAQGHGIDKGEAARLLDSGVLHCYGWASARGVGQDWVGHPISIWIGDRLETGGAAAAGGADVKFEPGEKEEVEAEADQRFWARIGDIRMLSRNDPRDAAYREVWKQERDAILRERHPAVTGLGSEFDYDPFSPELRRFAALGGLPAAGEGQEIAPDQMNWMMQVQEMLAGLTQRDWVRLRRVGLPDTDWQGLAEWLPRFIAKQRADDSAIAKVSALNVSGDLDFAYEAIHGMGRGSMDPVEAEVYGRSEELNAAAGEFRVVFRTRAVEIAEEMLRHAAPAMQAERSRMDSRKEREALFAALASPTLPQAVLDDHPILYNPEILKNAHNPRTPDDLGAWLRAEAYFQAEHIRFVSEHLHEKPDAVFGFDVVVAATLAELGLQNSVHQEIIEQGWGKSDGSSIFEMLLTFIPIIGPIIGAIEAFINFNAAVDDYVAQNNAYGLGMRTTKPSKTGVALAGAGLLVSGIPIAHGLSTTARSFGQIERLAGSEASAAGRAGTEAATAGELESSALEQKWQKYQDLLRRAPAIRKALQEQRGAPYMLGMATPGGPQSFANRAIIESLASQGDLDLLEMQVFVDTLYAEYPILGELTQAQALAGAAQRTEMLQILDRFTAQTGVPVDVVEDGVVQAATNQAGNFASLRSRPGFLQIEQSAYNSETELGLQVRHELSFYYARSGGSTPVLNDTHNALDVLEYTIINGGVFPFGGD